MLQYFNLLYNVKSTEYLIAKRNYKIAIHNRKWAYLFNLLCNYNNVCILVSSVCVFLIFAIIITHKNIK